MEQELDLCKEKTMLLTRENHNLQEELAEAYRLKVYLITPPDIRNSSFNLTVHIVVCNLQSILDMFLVGTAASDLEHGLVCDFY